MNKLSKLTTMYPKVSVVVCLLKIFQMHSNGLALMVQIAELQMLISDPQVHKLEELSEDKSTLEEEDNRDLIVGNNI